MIEACPHCGRKLMTRNSPLCSWCGEKIDDPEYQASAKANRQATEAEQSRIDTGRAAFQQDMKLARLGHRGRMRIGPSPSTVVAQRVNQLNGDIRVDIVAAEARAERARQAAALESDKPGDEPKPEGG